MKQIYSIFLVMMTMTLSWGQKKYPIPVHTSTRLFYIQHSQNINTFIYDVNIKNSKINTDEPIVIKRINFEEKGKVEDLNSAQKKLAYGIKSIFSVGDYRYRFTIAAYKNQDLYLIKEGNSYFVETTVNQKKIKLDKMFIQIKESNIPIGIKVNYVLFYGIEIATGKNIVEKLIIKD